jgi:c-di-GMP-binding flagellar brake protein YcgR
MNQPETRSAARKMLRCAAVIMLPGGAALRGRTSDISIGGVSLIVTDQLPADQICKLVLDTVLNGRTVRFTVDSKVVYSILSGTDGYRTGVQFLSMDAANKKLLEELLH